MDPNTELTDRRALTYLLEQYDRVLALHRAVAMDTPGDRELHAMAVAAADQAVSPIREYLADDEHEAMLDAYRVSSTSETAPPVVAVDELERLQKVDRYVQEFLNGYLDSGDLEDVRAQPVNGEVERLRPIDARRDAELANAARVICKEWFAGIRPGGRPGHLAWNAMLAVYLDEDGCTPELS